VPPRDLVLDSKTRGFYAYLGGGHNLSALVRTLLCSQSVKSTMSVRGFGLVRAFVPGPADGVTDGLIVDRPGGRAHVV
jgi:hypothetical protein